MTSRTILITGCDSGIGKALARELHERGHRVVATGLDVGRMSDLQGAGIDVHRLDITSETEIADLLARLGSEAAAIDVLINNAGYGAMGPTVEMPIADVRAQFDVNVFGTLALTQAIALKMIDRRSGLIVTIGSTSGVLTSPFAGVYCSTKTAVHALMDALRMELAPFGVRVVRVEPNMIRTEFGKTASAALLRRFERGSLYASVTEAAVARAQASQQAGAMPADEFARRVADVVGSRRPRIRARIGRKLTRYTLLKPFIPSRRVDRLLSRQFGLDRMSTGTSRPTSKR